MGILDKLKEKSKWSSLKYLGGYPLKNIAFYCALRRERNNIIIYNINTLQIEITIPKENILNLEIRQASLRQDRRIIMKVKHDGMEIELMFSALDVEKAYSKIVTAINTETTTSIVPTNIKSTDEKDPNKNENNPYWEVNFWQKEWFMWVMLIFFAPVGIIFLWRYKRFNFKPRVVITIASLAFFIFMWNTNRAETAKQNANITSTTQQEVKKEEPKKEDYGIKTTDLAKVKDVQKDGDNLIVSVDIGDSNKETDKNSLILPFRMATNDVVKQAKNITTDYKILKIKGYKGEENLFTATFSKEKVNKAPDEFMEILKYADNIEGYDVSKEDVFDTKEDKERFIYGINTTSGVLSNDAKMLLVAIDQNNQEDIELYSGFMVKDATSLKNMFVAKGYEDLKNKLNISLDSFIEFGNKFPTAVKNRDAEELKDIGTKLDKANKEFKETVKEINNK